MAFEQAPCPDRIWDDLGTAFAMGSIGGGVFHGIKGFRNSPRGDRLFGMTQAIKMRAPALGSAFAVWGGLFSTFDCTITHVRGKEDFWNAVMAGAATGGTLAARAGWKQMSKNALLGGVLLGMIEGVGHLLGKLGQPDEGALQVASPDGYDKKDKSSAPMPPSQEEEAGLEVDKKPFFGSSDDEDDFFNEFSEESGDKSKFA